MFDGFKIDNTALLDFISAFPQPAHLKDPRSKKYEFSNEHNLKVYGFNKPQDVVGLTVHDLDEFMRPFWGEQFADDITDLDQSVLQSHKTLTAQNRVFLDKFGLIHIQNMTKTPVLNHGNKVSTILTTSFDMTDQINRLIIFNKYKEVYHKKREACEFMMKHLKVNMFFNDILSEKEMCCLLWMVENNSYKYLAQKLNISLKTVESHINSITNKIKSKTIIEILEFLRSNNLHGFQ